MLHNKLELLMLIPVITPLACIMYLDIRFKKEIKEMKKKDEKKAVRNKTIS